MPSALYDDIVSQPKDLYADLLQPSEQELTAQAEKETAGDPAIPLADQPPSLGRRMLQGAAGLGLDYLRNPMTAPARAVQSLLPEIPALKAVGEFAQKPLVGLENRLGLLGGEVSQARDVMRIAGQSDTGESLGMGGVIGQLASPEGRASIERRLEELPQTKPTGGEKLLAGLQQGVIGGLESLETPQNIALLGGGYLLKGVAGKALTTYFTADMIKSLPDEAKLFVEGWKEGDPEKVGRAMAGAGISAAFIKQATSHLTKGTPDASRIRKAEALYGDLLAQPEKSAQEVSTEESGAGVQPQGEQVSPTETVLTPHEQAVTDIAKQRGNNIAFVDDLGPGRIARPTPEGGIQISRPELAKWLEGRTAEEVPKLLESLLDEETIHAATDDRDAEQYANSLTAAERALISRRYLGPGKWGGLSMTHVGHEALRFELQRLGELAPREILEAKGTELFKVHAITALERMIRSARQALGTKASKNQRLILDEYADKLRLVRQAQGLPAQTADQQDEGELPPVTEDAPFAINKNSADPEKVADELGGFKFENSPAAVLDESQGWFQALPKDRRAEIREAANAKGWHFMPPAGHPNEGLSFYTPKGATREQILAKWQDKLAGENAAAEAPAAYRKPKPGEQEELALPAAAGAPRPTAEELGATTEAVTPAKLDATLTQEFNQPRPSFASFADEAQKQFGNVQAGQLKEIWQDKVWSHLMAAPGEQLKKLRDRLGLEKSVSANIPDAQAEGKPMTSAERNSLVEQAVQMRREATAIEREAAKTRPPGLLPLEFKTDTEANNAAAQNTAKRLRADAEKIIQQVREAPSKEVSRRSRANAIARIGEKLIKQSETVPRKLQRSSVTPEDIGWWREKEGTEPAFVEFSDADQPTVENLTSGGAVDRTGRKALPESATKRVTALRDNMTGKVELVSTYKTTAGTYIVDPANPGGARPHVKAGDLFGRRVSGKPRYTPVGSILLDEPLQRFHQRLTPEGWTEFSDAARNEQQRRAESNVEAAALPQPEIDESRPAIRSGSSITDAEAGAVLHHLWDEVGTVDNPQDMTDAIESLRAKAESKSLNARDWQVVTALEKAVVETQRRNPTLSPVEAMEKALSTIYENAASAETNESQFIKKALSDFSKESAPTVRPSEKAAPTTGRELTMIDRRPPTVRAEFIPPKGEGPAAYRKGSELGSELEKTGRGIRAMFRRAETNVDVAAHLDSFETAGNNVSRQKGNSVRLLAGEGDTKRNRLSAAIRIIEARGDKEALTGFAKDVADGMVAALKLSREGKSVAERYEGRKWMKAGQKMADSIDYAYANWDDKTLQAVADRGKRVLDDVYEFDRNRKVQLDYRGGYIPGRYEGETFNDNVLQFGNKDLILGRNWRKAKAFSNYAEAMKEGYIPVNNDLSDLVEHRVRQSWREGGKELWLNSLKEWKDPDSGKPIVKEMLDVETARPMRRSTDPTTGQIEMVESKPKEFQSVPDPEYIPFSLGPTKDTVAVRRGYEGLLKTLTTQGHISIHPIGDAALHFNAFLKHGVMLILDTFHLARLGQYAFGVSNRPGYRRGFHVLEYADEDMDAAAARGLIPRSSVEWARGNIPVKLPGGRTANMTRRQVADYAQQTGLNVGRISDALYNESVRQMPVIGALNRFTFDRLTRGLMTEGAVSEFERLNKAYPELDRNKVMRAVVRDINRYYGSLGRQGVFRNPTIREINQLLLLAPNWVEGLIQKEVRGASRAVTGPYNALRNQFVEDAEKRIPFGTIGRAMGRGLGAYFALTQVINLITRHQTTFQNPEKDHKLDAWIPGGKNGFFISPMSVFAEVSHDLIRYAETKPMFQDAVNQLGYNKLNPLGRIAIILGTKRNAQGEHITSGKDLYMEAASQVVPFVGATPISVSKVAREAGHAIAPNLVSPNAPGALQRQLMATFAGIKAQPAAGPAQQIYAKAEQFVKDKGYRAKGWTLEQTDEPSYSKIRAAVRAGDDKAVMKQLESLRRDRSDALIMREMQNHLKRPLTGSKEHEQQFMNSLTPQEAVLYDQARDEQAAEWEKFLKIWDRRK